MPEPSIRAVSSEPSITSGPCLVSYASLHECLEVLAERGRNGTRVFRELLAVRPRDYVPPESNLERRVKKVGEDVGIRLRPQVTVGGTEHIGRADCQFEDLPEGLIEVMSERYHSAPLDQQSDETRFRRYEGAGFFALAVWEHDVWHRLTRSSASSSPSTSPRHRPPPHSPHLARRNALLRAFLRAKSKMPDS